MNIITPSGPSTHSEAFFGGLQADIMGDGEFLQAQINERILKENEVRGPRIALDRALDYACTWAFVTGYGTVIKAKIGLLDGHITVFLVFKDTRINHGRGPERLRTRQGTFTPR
ncbi:hypothetical protein NUW58_g4711 [Xylaria curta]|uniref:Uncharacterized protein n=1 Tax=Xylaria curta TaxID=42375 RepID=A0ACC1P5N9_9PEZI|nr:hypothetical protein NUW58_g4711 [Xylaria curta]